MRRFKFWHLVFMVLALLFLALIPFALLPAYGVDESTHSLVGLFFRDLIKDWAKSPTLSFHKIYDYAITYLIYYPKLSVHYPPLTQVCFSIIFLFSNPTIYAGRFFILISSMIFLALIYFMANYLYKDKKVALISLLIFATSPIIIVNSVQAIQEIPFVLFFTLTIFLFLKAFEKGRKYYALATISTVLTILSKWQAITIVPLIFFYTLLVERKKLKHTLISLVVAGIVLIPYYLILYKADLLFLPLSANVSSPESPKWYQISGLLFYVEALVFKQFFFPIGLILLTTSLWYLTKREKHWKLFLIWILVVFATMTFAIENKNIKYTINMLPAIVLPAAYTINSYLKKSNRTGIAIFAALFLLQFILSTPLMKTNFPDVFPDTIKTNFTDVFPDVQSIGTYVSQRSEGNILINDIPGADSPFIFEIAKNSNFTHLTFNPCLINDANESFDKTLNNYGIDYIISGKGTLMTERQKEFLNFMNTSGQFELEKEYEEFLIFKNNDFNKTAAGIRCNYICSTKKIVCSEFNKPSDSLR